METSKKYHIQYLFHKAAEMFDSTEYLFQSVFILSEYKKKMVLHWGGWSTLQIPTSTPTPLPPGLSTESMLFFKTEGLMSQVLYCLLWNNYINSNVPLESSKKQGCGICTMPLVNFSLKKYYCSNFHKNKKIMLFPPPPFCIFFKYW